VVKSEDLGEIRIVTVKCNVKDHGDSKDFCIGTIRRRSRSDKQHGPCLVAP
jgi:hypothetical protein